MDHFPQINAELSFPFLTYNRYVEVDFKNGFAAIDGIERLFLLKRTFIY